MPFLKPRAKTLVDLWPRRIFFCFVSPTVMDEAAAALLDDAGL